jgi:hypothetical protein
MMQVDSSTLAQIHLLFQHDIMREWRCRCSNISTSGNYLPYFISRVEALGNHCVVALRLTTMTDLYDLPLDVIGLIMHLVGAPSHLGYDAEDDLSHVAAWCRVACVCKG